MDVPVQCGAQGLSVGEVLRLFGELMESWELAEQTSCCELRLVPINRRHHPPIQHALSLYLGRSRSEDRSNRNAGIRVRAGLTIGLAGGAARREDRGPCSARTESCASTGCGREAHRRSRFGVSHRRSGGRIIVPAGRSDRSMARLNRAVESHGRGEERAVGRLEVPPGGPRFA